MVKQGISHCFTRTSGVWNSFQRLHPYDFAPAKMESVKPWPTISCEVAPKTMVHKVVPTSWTLVFYSFLNVNISHGCVWKWGIYCISHKSIKWQHRWRKWWFTNQWILGVPIIFYMSTISPQRPCPSQLATWQTGKLIVSGSLHWVISSINGWTNSMIITYPSYNFHSTCKQML